MAWPTMRARGSLGLSSDAGTTPAMSHSSSASDVVPVRSASSRKPARILASSRGGSSMPIAAAFSFPSGGFAIKWGAHHGAALPVIQGAAAQAEIAAAAGRVRYAFPCVRAAEPLPVRARAQLYADLRCAEGDAVRAA